MGAPPPQDMGKSLMSDLRSAISQQKTGNAAPEAKPQAAPAKQEAAAKPALEQPGDHTEAKIEAPAKEAKPKKAAAPKNPWDWEASVVDPDASAESGEGEASSEGEASTAEPEFKSESQKFKWGELRKKAEEFDTLQKKYAEMEQRMQEFEKNPKLPSEIEQELNELRQFRAGYDIQNTPEYAEAVAKPYQAQAAKIQEVADYAGVDINKLMDAVNEPNTLRRAKAIRDVLAASEAEMGEQEISIAVRAADTLHSEVYPKDLELRSKATEIQQGLKGRSEIESAKQREAREQSFKQASTEMFDTLKARLGPLKIFDDADVVKNVQGATLADPMDNPMMAAYQAQSAAIAPVLVQHINDLRTQLAAAQKVLKARGAAEATTGDTSRQALDTPRKGPDNGRSLMADLKSLGVR